MFDCFKHGEWIFITKLKRFTESEKQFILDNADKTGKEIGELLGRSPSSIRSFLRSQNIDKSHIFKPNKEEFILLYQEKSVIELSKYYNCDRHTITHYAKKIGVPSKKSIYKENKIKKLKVIEDKRIKRKEYYDSIDYSFFSKIDSHTKSYFLGLLAADGCVVLHKTPSGLKKDVCIVLHKDDIDILQHFYDVLNIQRKPIIVRDYAEIQIRSEVMFDDLSKYGIIPNKTWNLHLQNIPSEFYSSFLLGYFDGDGSINRKFESPSKACVSYCGTNSAMMSIRKMLDSLNLQYSFTLDKRDKYKAEFNTISFVNSTQKYIFFKTIYQNDIKCLKRKKDLATKFCNLIESNSSNRSENIKAVKQYLCRLSQEIA